MAIWRCTKGDNKFKCCQACPQYYGIETEHHATLIQYRTTKKVWIYYDLNDESDPEGHAGYPICTVWDRATVLMQRVESEEI
jgi:hypothetical protein